MEQVPMYISNELKSLGIGSTFISKNFEEFSKKYKEKFIVVQENKLIGVGDNFMEVMKKLKEKKIRPSSVIVQYIPTEEEILAI